MNQLQMGAQHAEVNPTGFTHMIRANKTNVRKYELKMALI